MIDTPSASQADLHALIEFQGVLNRISTKFINLPSDEIDGGIDEALETIGRLMDVDRSYVFRFSGDKKTMSCTHEWCAEGITPYIDCLQAVSVETLAWSNRRLLAGEVLHVPDVNALPAEAAAERREFERQEIRSLLAVPMIYLGETVGFLGFDAVRERKRWSRDSRMLLQNVGDIFVNALERKRAQAIQEGQQQFLELLARGGDFTETLENLIRLIEKQWPGMIGLVLRVEDGKLYHAASLSLSDEYLASIEGLEIGPQVGSCGTAAYLGRRVIVEDIAVDPRWEGLREIALADGLRACWSEPILSADGEVVGTFAMYYRYPRSPGEGELRTIEIAVHLAGVAIERKRAEEALRESERILKTLMSNLPGMAYRCRNDAAWTMRFVSQGSLELTGYAPAELVGNRTLAYRELIVPEDREKVREAVREAVEHHKPFQVTYRIRTRDGEQKWVWEQGQAVFGEKDTVVALEGFATDITERVRAQRLLEAQVLQRTRDVERRRRVAEGLRDILAVLGANRPLQEILDCIAVQARWLLNADGCAIYRYDYEHRDTIAEAMMGMPPEFEAEMRHFPLKESSAPQQATLRQEPYPVPDIPTYFAELRRRHETLSEISQRWMEIIESHFQAKLALPVVVRDEVFGGIELYYRHPRQFSEEDLDLALTFGDQAGLAIENAQLYLEVQRRADESRALFSVQRAITSNLTMDTVLQMIAEEARSITGAYRAVVLLLDESGERLVVQHVAGGHETLDDLVGEWISVRESVSGRSMLEGEPVLITDMTTDPRADPKTAAETRFRSQISVPLLSASGPLGIIAVSDPEPRRFGEDDVRLLMMLASGAVTGLENARLYEEEQERREEAERHRRIAEGLRDVLAVLNSDYTFAEVLDHIVYQASQLLGASAGVIYRAELETNTIVIEAASGAPESLVALQEFPHLPESVNRSIMRREPYAVSHLPSAVETDLPIGVEALPSTLVAWKRIVREHYRAYVAVPLIIKDQLYGALALYYTEPREFSEDDIDLAMALGGQVALGIESARLYAETRRRVDETQTLLAVQRAVTSHLDPDAVLQLIADEARRLTQAEQGAVYVLRGEALEIAVVSGDVPSDVVGYRLPVAHSMAGLAVREHRSFLVTDTQADDRVHEGIVNRVGATSFIVVPLLSGAGPLGTITVANKQGGAAFGKEDERVLTMMASSASVALENARLYQEEQARRAEAERRRRVAEGLRGILTILNSNRSLEEILDYIVEQAGELLGAEGGVIYRIDLEAGEIYVEATCRMPSTFDAVEVLPLIDSEVNRALLEGRPFGVPDFQQRLAEEIDLDALIHTRISQGRVEPLPERYRKSIETWIATVNDNFRSYMSVPLKVKDEIYGGVSFFYRAPQTFSEEDVRLAMALSDQAALAIENARLRKQAEESAVTQERNRLARDLHDAVSQTLFSASIIAEVLPRIWGRDPAEGERRLEELRQLTRGALAEMRMLLVELRPAALLDTPLQDLLGHLVEAFTGKTRVPVTFETRGKCMFTADAQIAFYRIAQEALNNVVKHADASHVWVDLRCEGEQVALTIRDDGRGFNPEEIPTSHFGVDIMRERAASITAALEVSSAPGEGTTVRVVWEGSGETSDEGRKA
ncbi:MAG: GAF domain-containing protein [Anaerolineae bacterium]